jgi:hypothetical protein
LLVGHSVHSRSLLLQVQNKQNIAVSMHKNRKT